MSLSWKLNCTYPYSIFFQINDFETIKVRAVLFQKSLEKLNTEIPPIGWDKRFYQPIFSEEAAGKHVEIENQMTVQGHPWQIAII